MHILGIHEDPACRGCLEDEETSGHVLSDCPTLPSPGTANAVAQRTKGVASNQNR